MEKKTRRLSEEVEKAEPSNNNLKDSIADEQPIINEKPEKKKLEEQKNRKYEKLVYIKIAKAGSTTLHTIFDSYGYTNRMSLIIPRTPGMSFFLFTVLFIYYLWYMYLFIIKWLLLQFDLVNSAFKIYTYTNSASPVITKNLPAMPVVFILR